jgi:hypothetical protein
MSSRVKPIGASLKTKVTVVVSPVVNAVSLPMSSLLTLTGQIQ